MLKQLTIILSPNIPLKWEGGLEIPSLNTKIADSRFISYREFMARNKGFFNIVNLDIKGYITDSESCMYNNASITIVEDYNNKKKGGLKIVLSPNGNEPLIMES